MESFSQFLPIIGLLLLALGYSYKKMIKPKNNKVSPPEPSGALPLVGHLLALKSKVPLPTLLGKLCDEYGPIYTLRLGSQPTVIVSGSQIVKEVFTTNERNFATRPDTAIGRYLFYDQAGFGLSAYGPYWREMRKMVTIELFTKLSLEKHKHVRDSEVMNFVNALYKFSTTSSSSTIHLNKWVDDFVYNMNKRTFLGKRSSSSKISFQGDEQDRQAKETLKKAMFLVGAFVVSDYIPFLECLDIGGHVKSMKQVQKELDDVFRKWFEKHVEKQNHDDEEEVDFMDAMMSTVPKYDGMFGYDRQHIIKATTLILMMGSSETTLETIVMAIYSLLDNPHMLKAVQKEIDMVVGREKWVEESDIKNLTYLQAVCKETLRMYPPGLLGAPHEAIDDCYIGGYYIPKGTRLILNIWKVQRDPQVWSDPDVFQPERFLHEHADKNYQGTNFEYIPFGSGRRMCPANTYVMQIIHLTLARLIQGFEISTSSGKVDKHDGLGIYGGEEKPLEVNISPRLSKELYQNA